MNAEQAFLLFIAVMAGVWLAIAINWLIQVLSGEEV